MDTFQYDLYLGQLCAKEIRLALCTGQSAVQVLAALIELPLLNGRDNILLSHRKASTKTPRANFGGIGDVSIS